MIKKQNLNVQVHWHLSTTTEISIPISKKKLGDKPEKTLAKNSLLKWYMSLTSNTEQDRIWSAELTHSQERNVNSGHFYEGFQYCLQIWIRTNQFLHISGSAG